MLPPAPIHQCYGITGVHVVALEVSVVVKVDAVVKVAMVGITAEVGIGMAGVWPRICRGGGWAWVLW